MTYEDDLELEEQDPLTHSQILLHLLAHVNRFQDIERFIESVNMNLGQFMKGIQSAHQEFAKRIEKLEAENSDLHQKVVDLSNSLDKYKPSENRVSLDS